MVGRFILALERDDLSQEEKTFINRLTFFYSVFHHFHSCCALFFIGVLINTIYIEILHLNLIEISNISKEILMQFDYLI